MPVGTKEVKMGVAAVYIKIYIWGYIYAVYICVYIYIYGAKDGLSNAAAVAVMLAYHPDMQHGYCQVLFALSSLIYLWYRFHWKADGGNRG